MLSDHDLKISAVIFREGDLWVAQGLEHDICAQARTLEEIHSTFARALVANAAVCAELGKEPFEGIGAAPQRFWDLFNGAKLRIEADPEPIRVPHPALLPSVVPHYRIIDKQAA